MTRSLSLLFFFVFFTLCVSQVSAARLNATAALDCATSQQVCNFATAELWETGVTPGAADRVSIDLDFLAASTEVPTEIRFILLSSSVQVLSLEVRGYTSGTSACLATIVVASSTLFVEEDLVVLEGGKIIVENNSALTVQQSLNSSSDAELVLGGPTSIANGIYLFHESGSVSSQSDLSVHGGFFGTLHLSGSGSKVLSGQNCTFVQLTAQTSFDLTCNISTVFNMAVDKEASSVTIIGDFRVAPDPDAKGPSGFATFYAPTTFIGNFSIFGSADAEFYEPLTISNATVLAADNSVLFFGFTNTLQVEQNFLVQGHAQLALYCPVRVSGFLHLDDFASAEVFSSSVVTVADSGVVQLSKSATFLRSYSGLLRVELLGQFNIFPSDGQDAILTIHTILVGVLMSPGRLVIRADVFLDTGSVVAQEIIQENRIDGRSTIESRLSGLGLLSAPVVNISGIFEPSSHFTVENDLNLLPGSTFQITVGPGNSSLEIRIAGTVRVDGAFVLVDEIVPIAIGATDYVEWPLFRLASQIVWNISGITPGYYDTVEDRTASGDGFTVVVRKILPPMETRMLVPIADRTEPPALPPIRPAEQQPRAAAQAPEARRAPTSGSEPIATKLEPSFGQPAINAQETATGSGLSPAAILMIVLLCFGAVCAVAFFFVKRHRDQKISQLGNAEVPLETPTGPRPPQNEPDIELSEA